MMLAAPAVRSSPQFIAAQAGVIDARVLDRRVAQGHGRAGVEDGQPTKLVARDKHVGERRFCALKKLNTTTITANVLPGLGVGDTQICCGQGRSRGDAKTRCMAVGDRSAL